MGLCTGSGARHPFDTSFTTQQRSKESFEPLSSSDLHPYNRSTEVPHSQLPLQPQPRPSLATRSSHVEAPIPHIERPRSRDPQLSDDWGQRERRCGPSAS